MLDNARYLNDGLRELGFHVVDPVALPDGTRVVTPIVPVLVGDDWKAALLWKALYDAGVYVNVALHPAVPPGGALLRTSVMATHERATLDRALEAFAEVKRAFEAEHGPLPSAGLTAPVDAPATGAAHEKAAPSARPGRFGIDPATGRSHSFSRRRVDSSQGNGTASRSQRSGTEIAHDGIPQAAEHPRSARRSTAYSYGGREKSADGRVADDVPRAAAPAGPRNVPTACGSLARSSSAGSPTAR